MIIDYYDAKGVPFAYRENEETVYAYTGAAIAHIDGGSMYLYSGEHIGFIEDGQLWNDKGMVILFTDEAEGGPIKPKTAINPSMGIREPVPTKLKNKLAPKKAKKTILWTHKNLQELFAL